MGYFVPDEQPVIWRGPMLHKAIQQLVSEAWWDEPDFLLIDMPPGTGDVALTLSEVLPRIEMYVVTTPQAGRAARRAAFGVRGTKTEAQRARRHREQSWFTGDDEKRYEIFGAGGGARLAQELGIALLGQIPLDTKLREGGDVGEPIVVYDPESDVSLAFKALAATIVSQGPARVYRQELKLS